MRNDDNLVCFAHGKESGPWGSKIRALAAIAKSRHWQVESPDYSHTQDPDARVHQLRVQNPQAARLVLCGSSMGGYVSALACPDLQADGLFLMAPALYLPGYDSQPDTTDADIVVVHGWRDNVVPVNSAIRFAHDNRARLHIVDDEHRLLESLDFIGTAFNALLARLECLECL